MLPEDDRLVPPFNHCTARYCKASLLTSILLPVSRPVSVPVHHPGGFVRHRMLRLTGEILNPHNNPARRANALTLQMPEK